MALVLNDATVPDIALRTVGSSEHTLKAMGDMVVSAGPLESVSAVPRVPGAQSPFDSIFTSA
jgi:hypothetical protein